LVVGDQQQGEDVGGEEAGGGAQPFRLLLAAQLVVEPDALSFVPEDGVDGAAKAPGRLPPMLGPFVAET